eukprot:CAMPEP_0113485292 /NCGR_PEP_ID=MMETSP0014_2-20120614/24408_1 /TAXON_ID=2857 /ORGANISM="Nitzschia sp." /LENGTH=287 /DNA_ID=CAMNT_0000378933 /DNA_START=5 /DNA_END=868 /DNA_ORIENTATION=- /assembly_acc=CAM_ASM_000159
MTITIKKAGSAAVSKVFETAKKSAGKAATATHVTGGHNITPTREVVPPRSVSSTEAPHMIPAKESTTQTMMPWKGWVDRLMKDKMDPNSYDRMNNIFKFWPEDPNDLMMQPYAANRTVLSEDGKTTAAYRETAPGSQPAVDVPLDELDADPYDTAYFKRDTRRRFVDPEFAHSDVEQLKLDMQDPDDPEVQAAKEKLASGPPSSPGNGNRFATGPSDFDPTGLRAVMAVNNKALYESLDSHMPDHLPTPSWTKEEAELYQWYKDRDLPVPIGGNWNFVGAKRRVAKW